MSSAHVLTKDVFGITTTDNLSGVSFCITVPIESPGFLPCLATVLSVFVLFCFFNLGIRFGKCTLIIHTLNGFLCFESNVSLGPVFVRPSLPEEFIFAVTRLLSSWHKF